MADRGENERLFRRVRFFARATIVAAVLVLPLSLVQTAAKRADSIYFNYGGTLMGGVREVCAFIADFFENGVIFAFLLVSLAVITLLVLRLAVSEDGKSWAPPLTDEFRKRALFFTTVTIVYALVCALLAMLSLPGIIAGATSDVATYLKVTSTGNRTEMLRSLEGTAYSVLVILLKFFVLVIGAHVVRILLAIAPAGKGPRGEAEAGSDE
jgi:hypothetical protein